jgi:predicted phage terminase large subunit-like protein
MSRVRSAIPEEEIQQKLRIREKCRTDLLYLCNKILGYEHVSLEVHPFIYTFPQSFREYQGKDLISPSGQHWYAPPHWDPHKVISPEEYRDRLLLDPRSHLKTSWQTIGHTIQWILNYPDICILVTHAAESKAIDILREIKNNFTHNQKFRHLFPEFVPQGDKAIKNFGTSEHFTVPNRRQNRRHATVEIGSMGKKMASSHYDVLKYTDIVDETTVTTPEQINKTKEIFYMGANLRVGPLSWRDVEGTIYDESDLYCELIENEYYKRIAAGEQPTIKVSIRGAYKKDVEGGQKFTPEERDAPYKIADRDIVLSKYVTISKGHKIPWWPVKDEMPHFTEEFLERMRASNEWIFACQQLLNPAATGATKNFDPAKIQWVSERALPLIPFESTIVTVDTASTVNKRSNDSVLTTGRWTESGDLVIVDIVYGKWLPEKLLDMMFTVYEKHRPKYFDIEQTEFVRGLMSSRRMMEAKRGYELPIRFLPRETATSKQERISNALQPPFATGRIKFASSLPEHVKERLKSEMSKFPSAAGHDDVLDTLADQYHFREGAWRGPAEYITVKDQIKAAERKFLGQESLSDIFEGSTYSGSTSILGSL